MSHKRISIFTAKQGHESISDSIVAALKSAGYEVIVNDFGDTTLSVYRLFYLYFPKLFKVPYKLAELEQARALLESLAASLYGEDVTTALEEQHPDLIISTWGFVNSSIERLLKTSKIPFINVLTDPRTFHSLMPSLHAVNLAFDNKAVERVKMLGIDTERVIESGWFVRSNYKPTNNRSSLLAALGISTAKPVLLLTSGSEGTNYILKLTPTLIKTNLPVTIVVACGKNKRLHKLIDGMSKLNGLVHDPCHTTLIPLTFTKELHRYMQAADLVVGKAGPNVLFESIATHTPFFAITHIAGQEDGNLDIIQDYNLGYVEENPIKAHRLISAIIKHPEKLKQFDTSLVKMAKHNARSKKTLLLLVKQLIGD